MYDSEPHTYGTFEKLDQLLKETGGHLDVIDHEEFFGALEFQITGRSLIEHLGNSGIQIALRDGDVIEKAGLISLIGTLKQIDQGSVVAGSRVLVCFTGGTACPDGLAVPDAQISDSSQVEQFFGHESKALQEIHG
jgi:hypothetical protein